MFKLSLLPLSLFVFLSASAQTDELKRFQSLYASEKYTELMALGKKEQPGWTGKNFYYIAMAYYKKGDDPNALLFFDKAITRGPVDHDMYYYKGRTLFYMRRHTEAIQWIDKALATLPEEPDFLAGKADVLASMGQNDSALLLYEKAIVKPDCRPEIYLNLADVYLAVPDQANALRVFNEGVARIPKGNSGHQTCLYNAGLLQYLSGKYAAAAAVYEQLLGWYADDYRSMAKLIQVYHAMGEAEKVKPWRKMLYDAYTLKKLPEEMQKMFCIDQFDFNGKKIMVFENFNSDETEALLIKHQFFVLTDSGTVDFQVRSESSFAVRMAGKDSKYVLCLVRGGSYSTYWNFVFNDDTPYASIRKAVTDILEKKVKPSAGTVVPQRKE